MPDFRTMYDSDYIHHYELPPGRDVVVTIAKCSAGEVTGTGGKKSRKPILHFVGKHKALALSKTNGVTIARLYGLDTAAWVGKRIALYISTTSLMGETVGCIRIRESVPPEVTAAVEPQPSQDSAHSAAAAEVGAP
jgi:hypothetical protein